VRCREAVLSYPHNFVFHCASRTSPGNDVLVVERRLGQGPRSVLRFHDLLKMLCYSAFRAALCARGANLGLEAISYVWH